MNSKSVPGGHNEKNLTGLRFDRLVVTSSYRRGTREYPGLSWLCLCDCGNEVWVRARVLGHGTKSCGCFRREMGRKQLAKYGIRAPKKLPPGQSALRSLCTNYQASARARKLAWGLDWVQFTALVVLHCVYCGAAPSGRHQGKRAFNGAVTYSGLDRQDNSRGYTPDNVVPCCGKCNRMKSAASVSDFLAHVERIMTHQRRET